MFLDSYFPTEKAYGVTTEHTLTSLVELGNEVTLFCYKPKLLLKHELMGVRIVHYKISGVNRILRRISLASYGMISVIFWNISKHLTYYENRKAFQLNLCDVIWTRETPIPQFLSRKLNCRQVIEIHNKPSRRNQKLLLRTDEKMTILCPISTQLVSQIGALMPTKKILWSPMGVKSIILQNAEATSEIRNHYGQTHKYISVGYFGKLAPNGISKGFEDLLELGLELRKRKIAYRLMFVGPSERELELLKRAIEKTKLDPKNIIIKTHRPHEESLKLMKTCDYLILPANRDLAYSGFPLKALEYVSSLRVVVAAKTPSNCDVFSAEFQPLWYEVGDISFFADLVMKPYSLEDLQSYLFDGYEYSAKFSWIERTKKILDSLG